MPTDEELKRLNETIRLANGGDRKAIAALREFLDDQPQIWQEVGDMARINQRNWTEQIARGDALATQAIERKVAETRKGLVGDRPSPTIEMLADLVLTTMLEVRHIEALVAGGGHTPQQDKQLTAHMDSAQRRHLAGLKTMEQVRKMQSENSAAPYLRLIGARATA
jgi:hypothetical protein